jgi:hypothetical protein
VENRSNGVGVLICGGGWSGDVLEVVFIGVVDGGGGGFNIDSVRGGESSRL